MIRHLQTPRPDPRPNRKNLKVVIVPLRQPNALRDWDSIETSDVASDPVGASADLREFVAILRRRWLTIALAIALTLGLAFAYLLTAARLYTATVSILIDARTRPPVGSDAQNPNNVPDATLVESQVRLLSADTVLRRVVQRENLVDDPEFVPTQPGLRTRLLGMFGVHPANNDSVDRLTRATMSLARAVVVKRSERTYVVDVDVSSTNPVKAARLANAVADAYMADQQAARADIGQRDSQWLNQRLSELQSRLQQAETKAQDFRTKYGLVDANGKNLTQQELADLTNELGRARARTIDARAKWEQVRRLAASGRGPDTTADASRSGVLDKLRAQYADIVRQESNLRTTLGDRHPALLEVQSQLRDTRRLIDGELRRISGAAETDYQQAQAAETETQRRIDGARAALDSKNVNLVQLNELDRDVDASRSVYEKFLRARETINENGGDAPVARVIAPAILPLAPSSPKTKAILFLALAAGLFGGTGAALLFEYLGAGVIAFKGFAPQPLFAKDERSLDLLVSIPRIDRQSQSGLASIKDWMLRSRVDERAPVPTSLLDEVSEHPESPFTTAIGELFDALGHKPAKRRGIGGALTVLVTSAHAGTGNTTIAANLARMAAARGQRTLLIDGDTSSPSLIALIPASLHPGLIDLGGDMRVIYKLADQLHVVPILKDEQRICRRLQRRDAAERIPGIAGQFDFVVIDGPAVDSGAEAREVADAVDRVVIVATGEGGHASVEDMLDALDVPDSKFAGTVLSMVNARKAA